MIYKEIYVGFVIKKLSKNENRNLKINSIYSSPKYIELTEGMSICLELKRVVKNIYIYFHKVFRHNIHLMHH